MRGPPNAYADADEPPIVSPRFFQAIDEEYATPQHLGLVDRRLWPKDQTRCLISLFSAATSLSPTAETARCASAVHHAMALGPMGFSECRRNHHPN
jgi:hypothetical protein